MTPKKRVNRDKLDFTTKQRMFALLTIDGGPPLSYSPSLKIPKKSLTFLVKKRRMKMFRDKNYIFNILGGQMA